MEKKIWVIDQDGLLIGEMILTETEDYREGAVGRKIRLPK